MPKSKDKREFWNMFIKVIIVVLCAVMLAVEFIPIQYVEDSLRNEWITKILQQSVGTIAVILLMLYMKIRLFGKVQHWLYLLPCIVIALDNFPLISYLNGNMQFERFEFLDVTLFAIYCLAIGLFEECVFRGIVFSVLAGLFSQDKRGLVKTFLASSVFFGLSHLFNLFGGAGVGATLLQVCYTTLTGGLFAFVLIKTKNIFCCAFVHALYNFCGLILSKQGLGSGIVFDFGTGVMMAVISLIIGVFVLYSLRKYKNIEQSVLYKRLGTEKALNEEKTES